MHDLAMIGDNVYIGGLYGDEFKLINNRIGVLKKIYSLISDNSINYLANIQMGKHWFSIDLKYVYKLSNNLTHPMFLNNNIDGELCQLHDIKSAELCVEEKTYHNISLCKTHGGLDVMLTISTLN